MIIKIYNEFINRLSFTKQLRKLRSKINISIDLPEIIEEFPEIVENIAFYFVALVVFILIIFVPPILLLVYGTKKEKRIQLRVPAIFSPQKIKPAKTTKRSP